MARRILQIERVLDIPIREVSGLCIHRPPEGPPRLVAVGDASAEIAWARLVEDGDPDWSVIDLGVVEGIGRQRGGSQFEAIAGDGLGRVLILREFPAAVHVLDLPGRRLLGTVELVSREQGRLQPLREAMAASLGEALLPLRDGRLMVSKEKDPPLILEFGPVGGEPLGIDPERLLAADEAWVLPDGEPPRLEVLARWSLEPSFEKRFRDISDVAAGPDRRIYLLSDQSSCIARLPATLPAPGDAISAEALWRLHGRPDKAEGLELLRDGRALVAVDERHGRRNLFVLGPPIAVSDPGS